MQANRLESWLRAKPAPAVTKPSASMHPPGFVVCPPWLAMANAAQQEIYRLAYERAKAAAETPRHYRLLFSVWN